MSYTVTRRTREIGIRMALGAARGTVLGLVLREVAWLALVGLVIGLVVGVPAAYALARMAASQLFGLTPGDPLTVTGAVTGLALVTLAAGVVPARRASRVDPMLALRHE